MIKLLVFGQPSWFVESGVVVVFSVARRWSDEMQVQKVCQSANTGLIVGLLVDYT